jgi:hypothetical protein
LKNTALATHEKISHEKYVQSARSQVVSTATALQNGEISYLLGAKKLDALRHAISVKDDDADFRVFVAIASGTDNFPLCAARQYWDKDALDRLQPEIDAAEIWAKEHGEPICAKLVQRFG